MPDAAFGQSTAEIIDHANSLLVSLMDKREELQVRETLPKREQRRD
jgi:hypothetical protein